MEKKIEKAESTKKEILAFNEAWKNAKMSGMGKEDTQNYLYLKTKVSKLIEEIKKDTINAQKVIMEELGIRDGEKTDKEIVNKANQKFEDVLSKLYEEKVNIDTNVIPYDALYDCVLNIKENDSLTTDQKAVIMDKLLKQ